jgi:hypothetical protein
VAVGIVRGDSPVTVVVAGIVAIALVAAAAWDVLHPHRGRPTRTQRYLVVGVVSLSVLWLSWWATETLRLQRRLVAVPTQLLVGQSTTATYEPVREGPLVVYLELKGHPSLERTRQLVGHHSRMGREGRHGRE